MSSRYEDAIRAIPRGETRSFLEVAAAAGRSGAARAVAHVVNRAAFDSDFPWHRVVAANGAMAKDPRRAAEQRRRLEREGARPRESESVAAWIRRRGVAVVLNHRRRRFLPAGDARVDDWSHDAVSPAPDEPTGRARGFVHADEADWRELPWRVPPRPAGRRQDPLPSITRLAADGDAIIADVARNGWSRQRAFSAAECRVFQDEARGDDGADGREPREASDTLVAARPNRFERSVRMERHGFGVGDYHYLREPPSHALGGLRDAIYRLLVPTARAWTGRDFPDDPEAFRAECRARGQLRGSMVLIEYPAGGVNHAHRDLYGDLSFPLQALLVLSRRGEDFDGGEFLLVEERADGDAHETIAVDLGDVVIFPSSDGPRGPVRHGMQTVTRGRRAAIGIVFHLAR